MTEYASPSSSVSSLSSSGDVVFSSPALAATRDNEVVIDFGAEDDSEHGGIFSWPAVESPAAHAPSLRPTPRTRIMPSDSQLQAPRQSSATPSQAALSPSDRWRHALAIAINREAEQAQDPSTSLARRIAARESARQSQSAAPNSEPSFPTARLLSRTIIPVSEPEPPADLRRLATTREAERQLHYRDWHRLGLFDPQPVAGSDNAGVSPGRLIPTASYARRRSRFPSALDPNGDEQDDEGGSTDMPQRLHRRMAPNLVSDAQLEREHEPISSSSSGTTRMAEPDRRLSRSRISIFGGRSFSRFAWYDGANDPNGEHFWDDDTPAARSRYWNARMSSATDDLLSLATAERQHTPATPPGLGIPENGSRRGTEPPPAAAEARPAPITNASTKSRPDPLPNALESMILPTPRQRFVAALREGSNSRL